MGENMAVFVPETYSEFGLDPDATKITLMTHDSALIRGLDLPAQRLPNRREIRAPACQIRSLVRQLFQGGEGPGKLAMVVYTRGAPAERPCQRCLNSPPSADPFGACVVLPGAADGCCARCVWEGDEDVDCELRLTRTLLSTDEDDDDDDDDDSDDGEDGEDGEDGSEADGDDEGDDSSSDQSESDSSADDESYKCIWGTITNT